MSSCNCNVRRSSNRNHISRVAQSHSSIHHSSSGRRHRESPENFTTHGSSISRSHSRYSKPHRQTSYVSRNRQVSHRQETNSYNPYISLSPQDLKSWDRIHRLSVAAITPQLKLDFIKYMEYVRDHFPCGKCKPHIRQKLSTTDFSQYNNIIENNKDVGYAKWSWEFHNQVNQRLSKPILSWDEFVKKYY
jgi:hypothetical protein